jgi:peptidoglycan/xylan/chitin deacetylase (PgdA/CDA1 family)
LRQFFAFLLCCSFLAFPVRSAQQEKFVALTFDDGPSGRFTRKLLEGLEQQNAKATFFLCGYRITQYPELTKRIAAEGHEIGLHGYSHKAMETMDHQEITREIQRVFSQLQDMGPVNFLRTPGGRSNKCIQAAAAEFDLSILYWSVDPQDWATHDVTKIVEYVTSRVRDGDVILMHDMSDSSVEAALIIIDRLQKQGFHFVTVSELAQKRGITPEPGKRYSRFPAETVK